MTNRLVYCIKEVKTNTWCDSSGRCSFSSDFNSAALFLQERNAKKALKEMMNQNLPGAHCPGWTADFNEYLADESVLREYQEFNPDTKFLVPEFKIVPFEMLSTV